MIWQLKSQRAQVLTEFANKLTAQQPEEFINDSDIDFGWLEPFFVLRADRSNALPIKPNLPAITDPCSSLWRGYVATLRLHADYRLELEKFDFPLSRNAPPQYCKQLVAGDFYVTFRPFFAGPDTVVPFTKGRLDVNRSNWQIDDQTIRGIVTSIYYHPNTKQYTGLVVQMWGGALAFAPHSLLPSELNDSLDSIVGRDVWCKIVKIDEERRCVVLQIERAGPVEHTNRAD